MKCHPDIAKNDPQASERFKEVTEAYSILKKHHQKVIEAIDPPDNDHTFVSRRPKYDGRVGSTLFKDHEREYVEFKPLDIDIPMPQKDVVYRPFFDDKNSVHPKAGTIMMCLVSFGVAGVISLLMQNTRIQDEKIQVLLWEKLNKAYTSQGWDGEAMHPALKVMQEDPSYSEYQKSRAEEYTRQRYEEHKKNPSLGENFSIYKHMQKARQLTET
jgi:curved DNA-binding protein CbpA